MIRYICELDGRMSSVSQHSSTEKYARIEGEAQRTAHTDTA